MRGDGGRELPSVAVALQRQPIGAGRWGTEHPQMRVEGRQRSTEEPECQAKVFGLHREGTREALKVFSRARRLGSSVS